MRNLDAINKRVSRRKYLPSLILDSTISILENKVEEFNKKEQLHIQFISDGSSAFRGFKSSYGLFSGVQSYIALAGPKNDVNLNEKLGFYGELLVLEATKQNLGTCWVGLTFDRMNAPCKLDDGDELICLITIGNVAAKNSFKENAIRKLVHRSTKSVSSLYTANKNVPDWFLNGMIAVQKAPSAINKQPVTFAYTDGITTTSVQNKNPYECIDLGIAKAHFQLGSNCGTWEWGNGSCFHHKKI